MTYLKKVQFSELAIWDVKTFFLQADIFNPKFPFVLFGDFLTKPIIEKTKIEDTKEYTILGARSYGKGAFINRVVKGDTLKMRTYQLAKENHLFWCKVDTKNGAFGIITKDLANGVASSNMTFAKIETSKANTEYVQLLFKSPKVNKYMDGYVTGTTNRKYIKPDQLRDEIKIPLPPLLEQNRIVENYNTKINLANEQEKQAEQLEIDIENYLFEILGIEKLEEKGNVKGLQFVNYSVITDWNSSNKNISKYKSFKYPLSSILLDETLAISVFRGKSPKYDNNGTSFILNQKCNRWNFLVTEYSKLVNDDWFSKIDSSFFTKEEDILINSTGEGTIGRATYIDKKNENLIYDSHLLLLRLDTSKVNSEFYTYLFNSKYGQQQVDDIKSAQTTKQTELGVNNLKKIMFPLPDSVSFQKEIANHITSIKHQIKDLKTKAEQNRENAIKEFEQEIFTKI